MKKTYKKLISIGIISIFFLTNMAMAKCGYSTNSCPTACPCPAQTCCPEPCESQCCPTPCQQPCCQNPCCTSPCENTCCQDPCCECPSLVEHLCTHKNSPVNLVKICGCKAILERHTVLEANFAQRVFSKKLCPGDNISFILNKGLCTCEGRQILPCGSQIVACVECIQPPRALNKPAQICLNFRYAMTPCGTAYPIQARIYNNSGMLQESKLMGAGKVTLYTLGLFGLGTGIAAAAGTAKNSAQAAVTLGMPIGFGVGLLTGLLTPGLHFRAKCGEKVLIQLTDCFQVCLNQ